MFHGKMKAVTFSYDDGVTQDKRLIEILGCYGLKATFNINSGLLGRPGSLDRKGMTVSHVKPRPDEIRAIYEGHEIAAHTLTHPMLPSLFDDEIIRQVEDDRLALSELAGYEVVGMAYPGGGVNYNEHVADVIRNNTGIRYARTTVSAHNFDAQPDLLVFRPTIYHAEQNYDALYSYACRFLESEPETPQLFYIWGHSYEFDIDGSWRRFEQFCDFISNRSEIFYGTNREVLLGE